MFRRLLLNYLSLTLLVLLGLEIPFALTYAAEQHERAGRECERQAAVLAEFVDEAIEEGEPENLPKLAAEYARDTGGRVLIVDPQGRLLVSSHPLTAEDTPTTNIAELRTALTGRRAVGTRHSAALGTDFDYVALPAASGSKIWAAVRLDVPGDAVDAAVHRMWLTLAGVGIGVLAVAALIGLGMARWMTRPVLALEQVTAELALGNLSAHATTDLGPPELQRLAASFNQTAARLQQLVDAQRGFAADASHQLRTPLTALRLRLENLGHILPEQGRANFDAAITQIDRLAKLIDGLLALADLDNGASAPEPADLDEILTRQAELWGPVAAKQFVDVRVTGGPVGSVWTVPGALEQVLDNLISNALRVAPPGSGITLACEPGPPHSRSHQPMVVLHVIDQGPGMTEEQRTRAFDRFWRAPGAPKGGSGLGLAIVQRLVQACGGQITLHPAPITGLDAAIALRPVWSALSPTTPRRGRHAAIPRAERAAAGATTTTGP